MPSGLLPYLFFFLTWYAVVGCPAQISLDDSLHSAALFADDGGARDAWDKPT